MAIYPVKDHRVASGFLPPGRPNHFGLDLIGPDGSVEPVGAPERGSIVAVWGVGTDGARADNTTVTDKRFDGYGPAGVLLKGASGVFHLLAHMDPQGWDVDAGPSARQTGPTGAEPTLDHPADVVEPPTLARVYEEGEQLGKMAPHVGKSGPHCHWEVRKEPIDNPSTRALNTFDPDQWVAANGDTSRIAQVLTVTATRPGIPWWLWLAIGYVLLDRR